MLTVTLYMRENCPLCENAETLLKVLQDKYPHRVIRIDIEENELAEYVEKIPVLEIGPYTIEAPFDEQTLEMTLGAAQDRLSQLDKIEMEEHQRKIQRGKNISFPDRLIHWLTKRYMLVFNSFVLLYVGLAFFAPVLQHNGNITPAKVIYTVYGRLCHQLAYRSWFLFGEQPAYPRAQANIDGLLTYNEATGLDPFDIDTAIRFLGNERIGYKTALCQRDVAIYSGILLFGIIFALTRRKIPGLPIAAWVLLGLVPIGLDGVSQIVSQLPWNIIPIRESTPLLRTITGGLFGFSTAWFGYPIVEEAMADTRRVMAVKRKVSEAEGNE